MALTFMSTINKGWTEFSQYSIKFVNNKGVPGETSQGGGIQGWGRGNWRSHRSCWERRREVESHCRGCKEVDGGKDWVKRWCGSPSHSLSGHVASKADDVGNQHVSRCDLSNDGSQWLEAGLMMHLNRWVILTWCWLYDHVTNHVLLLNNTSFL